MLFAFLPSLLAPQQVAGTALHSVMARKKRFRRTKRQSDTPAQNRPDDPQIATGIGDHIEQK